jgi:hypothetical protein
LCRIVTDIQSKRHRGRHSLAGGPIPPLPHTDAAR